MHVHASVQVFLDLVGHGVRGKGDDRRPRAAAAALHRPDGAGGGDPVHHRHLDVHQDQVVLPGVPRLHRQRAISDDVYPQAKGRHDGLEHQLVGGVVFRRQDLQL